MRKLAWIVPVAFSLIAGCAGGPVTMYSGSYTRTWVDEAGRSRQLEGPVFLELSDGGRYHVRGASLDLPPEGRGRFERHDDTIVFYDAGPPRAGFDLSQILEGPFEAASDERGLVLSQENVWGHSHLLVLEKSATDVPRESERPENP